MPTNSVGRMVWRMATPMDVLVASLPRPTLYTEENKKELRAKHFSEPNSQPDKPRPFGMLILSEDAKECFVYSRTADPNVKPNGLYDLGHQSHDSDCGINERGVVQLARYFQIKRSYWDSRARCKPTPTPGNCFLLLCYCEQKFCRRRDKLLIEQVVNLQTYFRKEN